MTNLEEMKIYLLCNNLRVVNEWKAAFDGVKNVEAVYSDFDKFMVQNKVDCVVSPANSYGLMDGGYDLAITEWFGEGLPMRVREKILCEFFGEQPVGTSIIVDTDRDGVKLIHTPSMRYPEKIRDPLVVYTCMRTCLICAMQNGIRSIVIPAFGGLTGCLTPKTVAEMMRRAYDQLADPPKYISWRYAQSVHFIYCGELFIY